MRRVVPLLLFVLATPLHAAPDWRAERVNGPVYLMVEHGDRTLEDGARVDPMSEFSLADEQAALTLLSHGSRLRTRGPSALRLFDSGDQLQGTDMVARVQLTTGSARIDVREPLDLRVNAGDLRTRTVAGEAWIAADAEADTACLLRGMIEVQTRGSMLIHELSRAGECVRIDRSGKVERLRPDAVTLNAWLARADGGINPFSPALLAGGASEKIEVVAPAPTAAPAQPPAAVAASSTTSGWHVVVGAFDDDTRAQALADSLSAGGDAARIFPASGGMHRVAVGSFATRDEAERARDRLRQNFSGAWLLAP
jgi:hypothetical protein